MSRNELQLADVLNSVLWSLQNEIAPAVTDEYAASICKTAAALLRSCLVRLESEGPFLVEDIANARAVLAQGAAALYDDKLCASLSDDTEAVAYVSAASLGTESDTLTGALTEMMQALRVAAESAPEDAQIAAARAAADAYLGERLTRQAPWLLEPFSGKVR